MRIAAIGLGIFVLSTDLLTKSLVKNWTWLYENDYTVIDGFFTLQLVRNEGIAFGLLHETSSQWKPLVLSAIAITAISVVGYYLARTPSSDRFSLLSLGLLLGGIMGNLIDRIMNGYVVDFLTLHWKDQFAWPTFNIADAAITTGVFIILARTIFTSSEEAQKGVAALLLIPFSSLIVGAQDTGGIVEKLQAKYEEVDSFRARFQQTISSRGIEQSESGIVMMKRPGRMYWEYHNPTEKYFVADGKKTYFYVPQHHQVMVMELDLESADSPLLFLLGKGSFEQDFEIKIEEHSEPEGLSSPLVLRLIPREPHPEFTELLLEIDPASYMIHKLTVIEPIGQQNEYLLTDIQENVKIPDRQFRLKIPSNVEVIEQ